jgi:hypothetical protein
MLLRGKKLADALTLNRPCFVLKNGTLTLVLAKDRAAQLDFQVLMNFATWSPLLSGKAHPPTYTFPRR